jgi:hypothetical protein
MRMKNRILFFCLLLSLGGHAQEGYEIKVTFTPYRDQYIYLGHYFGKTYPIIDSVKLDAKSAGVFKGNKPLQGGIYLIGYPNRSGFFEVLVDKQQRFSSCGSFSKFSRQRIVCYLSTHHGRKRRAD